MIFFYIIKFVDMVENPTTYAYKTEIFVRNKRLFKVRPPY